MSSGRWFRMMTFISLAICLGIYMCYRKYKIVIGGTFHKADILNTQPIVDRRGTTYAYTVGFTHKGIYLKKPVMSHTFEDKTLKHSLSVYYNPKHPEAVMLNSFFPEAVALSSIFIGILMFVFR